MKSLLLTRWRRSHGAPEVTAISAANRAVSAPPLRRIARSAALLAVAFLLVPTIDACASDPVGIYGWVEKVVAEPATGQPERVQVWGAFAIAEKSGYAYRAAQTGYLYLTINPENTTASRNEWADLKSVAGTRQVVAFGTRYGPKPTIRGKDERAARPDPHPIGFGLTKVVNRDYAPIRELLAIADKQGARPAPATPDKPGKEEKAKEKTVASSGNQDQP